jgi:putative phosphonate metabolism protein
VRVAIFFSPPADHPLTIASAQWLGRDAYTGERFAPVADGTFHHDELAALTAEPRRYGFHATMKAPFRPADGVRLEDVEAFLARFCEDAAPCPLPGLRVGTLGPFFALTPDPAAIAVNRLAARVVESFEPLRAPLDAKELERRRRSPLTPVQDAYLAAWGYPYVFDEFQFHMTLTGPVPAERQAEMGGILHRRFDNLLDGVVIGSLAVFVEEAPGAEFRVHAERRFGSAGE